MVRDSVFLCGLLLGSFLASAGAEGSTRSTSDSTCLGNCIRDKMSDTSILLQSVVGVHFQEERGLADAAKHVEATKDEAEEDQKDKDVVKDGMGLSWSLCAHDGEDCPCDSGTVRYGRVSRWVVSEKGFSKGGRIPCNTQHFNLDPVEGQPNECWCLATANPDAKQPSIPRVGIVMLSRRAPDLKSWLQYHLDYMGVDHVFINVEDSPHFDEAWSSLSQASRKRITVWKTNVTAGNVETRPADDYTTLQARQLVAMQRAKDSSRGMGIDWLFHIDDDELLYAPLHRSIGEILSSLPVDQVIIPNVEALYKSPDAKSCFTEVNVVNMNVYSFVSYVNGKPAVRVSVDDAVPAGPHAWRTSLGVDLNSLHLDAETFGSPLWLVHFESCLFDEWKDKYQELGNTSPEKVSTIPFPWYRESITRFMECGKKSEDGAYVLQKDARCSQASLRELWSRWKTLNNPQIQTQDLMPISIPWDQIKASAK